MEFIRLLLIAGLVLAPLNYAIGQSIENVVEWIDAMELEEPDDVFTVLPTVTINGDYFIVTDFAESQVRIYTRDGRLLHYFGEQGIEGPGQMSGPANTRPLPDGGFAVPDLITGNLNLFNENGSFRKRHTRITAGPTLGLIDLPDNEMVLIGATEMSNGSHPLLHRFDLETGTIEQSFFPHPISLGSYGGMLYSLGNLVSADRRGNILAATFMIQNKLYFFDLEGRAIDQVELPLAHFRQNKPEELGSHQQFHDAMQEHSFISDVFWWDDAMLIIQYYDFENYAYEGGERTFTLAGVSRDGEVLFEIQDTPQLFAVDSNTQELFFSDPDYEFDNYWRVARLKNDVLSSASQ